MKRIGYNKIIFAVILVLAFLIFIQKENKQHSEGFFSRIASHSSHFLQFQTFLFFDAIVGTVSKYTQLLGIKEENAHLRAEKRKWETQRMYANEIRDENRILRDMLQFQQRSSLHLLPVRVVSFDPFPDYQFIQVNKGAQHGIQKNMLAVSRAGVVGIVFKVQAHTSQILPISSRNIVIPGMTQDSQVIGLVSGLSRRKLQLIHMSKREHVQPGELVVTTSLNNSKIPSGLLIGEVTKVEKKDYGIDNKVEITPAISLTKIRELFVVLKP